MSKYPQRQTQVILSPEYGKVPPCSPEIEMHVIGSFIMDYHLIAKFPYLKEEVFYKETHRKIYKALSESYEKDLKPDLAILTDYLRTVNELESVGGVVYLTQLSGMALAFIDTHVKLIMDKYFYRKLIEISHFVQQKSFDATEDPISIIDFLQNNLMEMTEFDGDIQNNFSRSLEKTLKQIDESSKGDNLTVIKTGLIQIDKRFTFRTRFVCLIGGPEGSAKSKFASRIARGMLDNESELAIQWFSFEDGREDIIRGFLSMDVKKTSKELQSIEYKMTDQDKNEVRKQSEKYKQYIIEFYDRATSIGNILSRSKRFGDKYKDKKKVIIIDNLGLIDCDKVGIDRDDFIAAKIKSIADNTNASVILLHHFTKEIARKQNIEDGYRPRKEYLKGSTRILDYVQQALFVNLLKKYPDLLAEEKHLTLDFLGIKDIEFTETNYDKHLWAINGQRDKETENITDLRIETLVKLRTLLSSGAKFSNGKPITFPDIVQKYTEYSNFIDTRNKGREDKFKTKKTSIYTFIVKKMFNESYITSDTSPRAIYLYGKNKNLRNHIDDLFIVESMKSRDGDNTGENAIFRFIVDLGYNLFNEVDNDTDFKLK